MSQYAGTIVGRPFPIIRNGLTDEILGPEDTATLVEAIASEEMESGLADFNEDEANEKVYTFSYGDRLSFHTANYVIHEYFKDKSSDSIVVQDKFTWEYEYDLDKFQPLLAIGSKVYTLKDNSKLMIMSPNLEGCSIMLAGNFNLMPIVEEIKDAIKNKNPLRNKNIQLIPGPQGYEVLFKPVPTTTFDEVILDQAMKDDIYDNTIFQLKHIDSNNGIILSGSPGTGKSKSCQAIISEAIKEGFSTCFVVQKVDWSMLDEFIREFLAPAVVILEDIDAFCQSREETLNGDLASFLQFINGLSEHKEKLVFVCTTNHLDHLDKAVANRPMRFNRKFEFKYPTDDQIDQLLALYFKDVTLSRAQKRLCYGAEFSGSHIKELWRTATLLSKKQNKSLAEVFEKAVETVASNFSTTLTGKMGFNS